MAVSIGWIAGIPAVHHGAVTSSTEIRAVRRRAVKVAIVSATDGRADVDRSDPTVRHWVDEAVRKVEADANRSADTHLLVFDLPRAVGRRPVSEG